MIFSLFGKIFSLILALGLGVVQGALFFADFAPGETQVTRLIMSVCLAVIGGVVFGYNFPRLWPLALLNTWVLLIFIGLSSTAPGLTAATAVPRFGVLASPVLVSIVAGFIGAKIKTLKKLIMLALVLAVGIFGFGTVVAFVQKLAKV